MLAAILAALAAIGETVSVLWGVLVEFMPFLAKIGPWLVALFPMAVNWFRKAVGWYIQDTAARAADSIAAIAVRVIVLEAWAVVIALITTSITGLSIREAVMTNPFSGFPGAMMFLVNSAFPVKFGLSLITSYIIFRGSLNIALMTMSRAIKFAFGA